MKNRLLALVLAVALAALASFGYAVWSGEPLPTRALFDEPTAPDAGDLLWWDVEPGSHGALACPPDYCGTDTDTKIIESPVFELNPGVLYALMRSVVSEQPHVRILRDDRVNFRLDVSQRSPILGIPESASLQVISDDETGAVSVMMVSRSRPGAWEPGGNKSRVLTWLGALERTVRLESAPEELTTGTSAYR